jgi:fused signal recognition particle receptor
MIQTLFGTPAKKPSFFERIQDKMSGAVQKTKENLVTRVDELFRGPREISPELLRDLERLLISADVGVRTAAEIVGRVRQESEASNRTDAEHVRACIRQELVRILESAATTPREIGDGLPLVVMMVGINGTGKTTTIGKLAQRYRAEGNTVLLCAGDTFRAAATEQLEIWGQRTGAEVIRQKPGADPSAVLYDALTAARARAVDFVIVDTAGRLHTKTNLMQELSKMRRTAEKLIPGAPHETLLVLDATTGQNGLQQARQFTSAAGVTGLVVTKLDGTARGGIVVAIARELGLPVRYVGTGEKADDLIPFDARQFADSLFGNGFSRRD